MATLGDVRFNSRDREAAAAIPALLRLRREIYMQGARAGRRVARQWRRCRKKEVADVVVDGGRKKKRKEEEEVKRGNDDVKKRGGK